MEACPPLSVLFVDKQSKRLGLSVSGTPMAVGISYARYNRSSSRTCVSIRSPIVGNRYSWGLLPNLRDLPQLARSSPCDALLRQIE